MLGRSVTSGTYIKHAMTVGLQFTRSLLAENNGCLLVRHCSSGVVQGAEVQIWHFAEHA